MPRLKVGKWRGVWCWRRKKQRATGQRQTTSAAARRGVSDIALVARVGNRSHVFTEWENTDICAVSSSGVRGPKPRRQLHVRTIQRRTDGHPSSFRVRSTSACRISSAGHTGFASGGQAIGIRATAQHRTGAEAEGLDHVRATLNASIHQYLDLTIHPRRRPSRQSHVRTAVLHRDS
jgi:hypothetical protein